jgi:large subunit ribosomal protein L18
MITQDRRASRDIRKARIRRRVRGSAARPRLAVFRSLNHIYAQLVDDEASRTIVAADSRSKEFRERHTSGGNVAAAKAVGSLLAERARAQGLERVIFDRGGYMYHGRVKALADAARAGGLVF